MKYAVSSSANRGRVSGAREPSTNIAQAAIRFADGPEVALSHVMEMHATATHVVATAWRTR